MKSVKIRILEKKQNKPEILAVAFKDFPDWKGKKVIIDEVMQDGEKVLQIHEVKPLSNKELRKNSRKSVFIRIN